MLETVSEKLNEGKPLEKEELDFILGKLEASLGKNEVREMPKKYKVALGYEPNEDNYVYVSKNSAKEDFGLEEPSVYLLVCVVKGVHYLVDGSNDPEAWDLSLA